MLAGMLAPPNLGRSYGDAFRQVYRDVATAHNVPLYPFFLDGAVLENGLMQPDGIHPNARRRPSDRGADRSAAGQIAIQDETEVVTTIR